MPKQRAKRTHAQWSASATARNWLCPGNLALAFDIVAPPESKPAAWGTACHEVAERLLKLDVPVDIGDEIETDRHIFYIDQEMLDCANVYFDYIHSRMTEGFDLHAVEQKFDLADLGLPMEIGGTADCVLYSPVEKGLEIVDLKTGKGKMVEATNNAQGRLYALGVLVSLNLKSMPVKWVQTTIVQPRLPHRDGIIRSETLHVSELMDWTIDLDVKVRDAADALMSYATAKGNTVVMDEWAETFLEPGEEQCTFGPAAGGCPALRKRALEIAGEDEGTFKSNVFAINSIEAVEADLDMLEHLESWVRDRRALAHEMASRGMKFDHWTLVEKIGHRKFVGKDTGEIVTSIRDRIPLSDEQLFDRKLKSPAGIEREIGRHAVEEHLGDIIIRPVTGTDLIRNSNAERTPALSVADRLFQEN